MKLIVKLFPQEFRDWERRRHDRELARGRAAFAARRTVERVAAVAGILGLAAIAYGVAEAGTAIGLSGAAAALAATAYFVTIVAMEERAEAEIRSLELSLGPIEEWLRSRDGRDPESPPHPEPRAEQLRAALGVAAWLCHQWLGRWRVRASFERRADVRLAAIGTTLKRACDEWRRATGRDPFDGKPPPRPRPPA